MSEIHNFPPISTQEWKDKVTADLRGADFEKKLVWRTSEGFNMQPLYRQEDLEQLDYLNTLPGSFPYVRGNAKKGNDWLVRQDFIVKDAAETNKQVLDVLNKGITSLGFCLCDIDITAANLEILFEGICLDAVEVNISAPAKTLVETTELFVAYVKAKGYEPKDIKGFINFDQLGRLLKKGNTAGVELVETVKALIVATADYRNLKVIGVNAKYFNNAGAYISQELAYGLSMGNEYMATLTEAGIDAWDVAANIKFNFGISSNYFMEVAKFRAARLLWAKIVESYQPKCKCDDDCGCEKGCKCEWCKCVAMMSAHAETSMWNKTVYDTHANLLRTQTESMSAALGGVDSITVIPFDTTYKSSDKFSERIARNQQLLLKEESHLDKIADPTAGSYYVENLTNEMAAQAWKLFVAVEEKGGFLTAIKEGFIQAEVKVSADKRRKAVATRRENLLGTNQFPNFTETKLKEVADAKASQQCACSNVAEEQEVEPLVFFRGSEDFEALRLSVEAKGKTPKVFLLKTGNVAFRQARAQFIANFFGCAGFEIIEDMGYNTATEGAEAALASGAEFVVICSSDDEYTTAAPEAFKAIDGKATFVVAGAPACTDELKDQGITNFVNVRSNVLEELKRYAELA